MEFFGINPENYVVAGIHHHQDEDDEEDNNAMLVDPLSIDGESIITGDIEDEQADNEGNSTGNVFDSFHSCKLIVLIMLKCTRVIYMEKCIS